ncbi:MAG: hypothetical protein ACLR8J_03250 [Sutterella wadsworthensis]
MTPVDVDPLPERPRVKRQSELPELIYAYHAMERGKAGSDEVSLLQNGLTLPGRRPVFTVERHREAQTARLRSMLDPIDRPSGCTWRSSPPNAAASARSRRTSSTKWARTSSSRAVRTAGARMRTPPPTSPS